MCLATDRKCCATASDSTIECVNSEERNTKNFAMEKASVDHMNFI